MLKEIADRVERGARLTGAIAALAVAAAFVVLLCKRLDDSHFRVKPLELPDSLAKAGIDGRRLAALVRERLHEMQRIRPSVRPGQSRPEVPIASEPIEFELPGTGITLGQLEDVAVELGYNLPTMSAVLAKGGKEWTVWLKIDSEPVRVRSMTLEGDEISAVPFVVEALARDTLEALDPIRLASYLYSRREAAACEAALRKCLLDDDPQNDPEAYNIWGLLLTSQKEFAEAEKKFDRALGFTPKSSFLRAKILNNFGLVDMERAACAPARKDFKVSMVQAAYTAAREDFEKALRIVPDYAIAHYNLGNSWILDAMSGGDSKLANLKHAEKAYLRALQNDPSLSEARINRLVAVAQLGDPSALDQFKDSDGRSWTRDPDFYANWGQVLQARGDIADAADKFERALELSPTHLEATLGLAFSRNSLGDGLGALEANLARAAALLENRQCQVAKDQLDSALSMTLSLDPSSSSELLEKTRALEAEMKAICRL